MSFTKKTIKEIDLHERKVLVRTDYNVPIKDGQITDDYRLTQSLPTIHFLLEQGCKIVLISHLGRPESSEDTSCSLRPVAQRLGELLQRSIAFAENCVGEHVAGLADKMQPGDVLLLENLRFHEEEEKNDESFAKAILEAVKPDVFVQDGFGVVHRAHASTDAVARLAPQAVAGFLVEKEVDTISRSMEDPEHPLVALVGGAKISDKIEILNILIEKANVVAVGGAMANDFLVAEGHNVGKSVYDEESVETAQKILEAARRAELERDFHFLLPVDAVVSKDIQGKSPTRWVDLDSHSIADIMAYPKRPDAELHSVASDEMILDIGPISASMYATAVKMAKTVVWNGTMGVTETPGLNGAAAPFAHGTRIVVDAMIGASQQHKNIPFTVVGGGDTVGYVENEGLIADFGHVSTGGGASLDLMSGKQLPGVVVLNDKG